MKNPHTPTKRAGILSGSSQCHSKSTAEFLGTSDPRKIRLLKALADGPVSREAADRIAAVSNAPHIIMELRNAGLRGHLHCERHPKKNRDGITVLPGTYVLSPEGERAVKDWLELFHVE